MLGEMQGMGWGSVWREWGEVSVGGDAGDRGGVQCRELKLGFTE